MGCRFSKTGQEVGNIVSLCRERKRLIRSAVEFRQALAHAHSKYSQSLYAVALAIRLFVSKNSSRSSSPFLISCPKSSEATSETSSLPFSKPTYNQNRTFESVIHKTIPPKAQDSTISSHCSNEIEKSEDGDEEVKDSDDSDGEVCEHFHDRPEPSMPPPPQQYSFGWDFFNPFDVVGTEMFTGFTQDNDDCSRNVKEAEGFSEVEEIKGREFKESEALIKDGGLMDANNISKGDCKGLNGFDPQTSGRQLLEALKDVEDHFIKAYDFSVNVCKMLETNVVHLQPENSNKLTHSIKWKKAMSFSSHSSSSKSFPSFSSKSSSNCSEFNNNDIFYRCGGMESGSHSLTLGRLYAWEKKLYDELKAGYRMRRIYQSKCSQLSSQSTKRQSLVSGDKTNAEARELFSRISVTLRNAESISKRIQMLRDEELQPQIVELLQGLCQMWKVMLESHQSQKKTMFEVKSFICSVSGKQTDDSHHLATLRLEAEIQNWRACFVQYVSAQKAYVEALNGWLSKFISPEISFHSRDFPVPQSRINTPPLDTICHDWLVFLQKLPDRKAALAMKELGKSIKALWIQQRVEQRQKRKVDELTLEFDRRILAFQQEEGKILESKLSQHNTEMETRRRFGYLAERKSLLDMFRNSLEAAKAKQHDSTLETQRLISNGFHNGFSSVFESLIEFSMASEKMYTDLVDRHNNA